MKTIPFLYVDEKHILFYEEIKEEECVTINFVLLLEILGVYVFLEIYDIMKYEYRKNGNNMVGKIPHVIIILILCAVGKT